VRPKEAAGFTATTIRFDGEGMISEYGAHVMSPVNRNGFYAHTMRLTKLEHAALVLQKDASTLIVDPGSFTTPISEAAATGVVAVVITHEHGDHWTPAQLQRILDHSPSAHIFAPEGVSIAATGFDVTIVAPGDEVTAGPFALRFFGGRHAEIHSSIPIVDNVGVLVNEQLYYAGDSFFIPEGLEVDVLAVPAGAPWLKISEVMDFVLAVAPKRSFPTHEMVLSAPGKNMANDRIEWATEQNGGTFFPLKPGDALQI
jgi:L-ascorbate metabolism protein UlaG (beta-lactamase superfamily)